MAVPVEVARVSQAIEAFLERPPRDLPDGILDGLKGIHGQLAESGPVRDTPGSRAALQVAPGTEGTGAPMAKAALGPDGPAPGQKEYKSPGTRAALGAAALRAKLVSGGEGTPQTRG